MVVHLNLTSLKSIGTLGCRQNIRGLLIYLSQLTLYVMCLLVLAHLLFQLQERGCIVYANDLNPESYKALNHNIDINKVRQKIHSYNIDGRDFLRTIFSLGPKTDMASNDNAVLKVDHVIMNLPAIAIDFLDVFSSIACHKFNGNMMIHCYCFSKKDNPFKDAEDRVQRMLGNKAQEYNVHLVRNVAPKKVMMCVSFKLLNSDQGSKHDNPSMVIPSQETLSRKGIKRKVDD